MDSIRPSEKAKNVLAAWAVTALCFGWSASALSAATTAVPCNTVDRDLRNIEIPVAEFSVRAVDHVSTEPDPAALDATSFAVLEASDESGESVAPFLYLAPRVASVLRDVFDATREIRDEQGDSEISSSPVAEFDRIPDISELLDNADVAIDMNDEINLPRFQQRMFRTDI